MKILKHIIGRILPAAAIALTASVAMTSCADENPFIDPAGKDVVYGKVSTRSLTVDINKESAVRSLIDRRTRAAAPQTDNFTVDFTKTGEDTPYVSYRYSQMPEIVTLPVGEYTVSAWHGEDLEAAWENPRYQGAAPIVVTADDITEMESPIVCRLSNVRVSIDFDPVLLANMSADSKVSVQVGKYGPMEFSKDDTSRSGYFKYDTLSSMLTATFSGNVEGLQSTETKAYNDVAPGKHYRITFRLHQFSDEDPGDINGGITVDANVEVSDMNESLNTDDDILIDDMRPVEKPDEPTPDPSDPAGAAPAITANPGVDLSVVNDAIDGNSYILYVHSDSDAGIKTFDVEIISSTLTPDELRSVGLDSNLNIANTPASMAEGLGGLGLPINVAGQKDVTFDITNFIPMLNALGSGSHEFRITVSDANGTTVKSLKLRSL